MTESRNIDRSEDRLRRGQRWRGMLAVLIMLAGVMIVYFPKTTEDGRRLLHGMDHILLHLRRITFAQDSLRGPRHELPGWYPRELLGTPFWSNVSNFPFIPTRLIFFFTSDPLGLYTRSVLTSALLAAIFTYLYCRRIGVGCIGTAAAGWTFAWQATLDDKPAVILPANHAFMAVKVPAGPHEVRLSFATPGRRTGIVLSIGSFVALATLSLTCRRIIAAARARNIPLPVT